MQKPKIHVNDLDQTIPRMGSDYLESSGPAGYHLWYYNRDVWRTVTFMGVYCAKNVLDLWNYQEIVFKLKPALIVEFGTYAGGTAIFLSSMMKTLQDTEGGFPPNILTVDIDHGPLSDAIRYNRYVECLLGKSTDPYVQDTIRQSRIPTASTIYILDSDHSMINVMAELEMLRDLTRPGDYVIVEDSNINGHPVLPHFGPGPWEAIEEYERRHPDDYEHDADRENKFGMTFNPRGYLVRRWPQPPDLR